LLKELEGKNKEVSDLNGALMRKRAKKRQLKAGHQGAIDHAADL
jgi:hypothetical protein